MNALRPKLWWGALTGFYKPGVQNIPGPDRVALFLYSARSVILIISAQAALIAGLLAAAAGFFDWVDFVGVLAGYVVAHMISNLSNDYFGFTRGHDTPDSPRMRYTVHPLASGLLDRRTLLTGLALLGFIGLCICAFFIVERGWMAAAFAVGGVSLLFLYDAAPTPLKSIGLGEIAVLLVWGPLMVGGGFAMISGQLSANAMLASLPYGLGVMTILMGKHIDQLDFDSSKDIRTLPGADRGTHVARPERCGNLRDLRHRRHLDWSWAPDTVCRSDRHRISACCSCHQDHEPAASGSAARWLRRLAALVSPRLPRA